MALNSTFVMPLFSIQVVYTYCDDTSKFGYNGNLKLTIHSSIMKSIMCSFVDKVGRIVLGFTFGIGDITRAVSNY